MRQKLDWEQETEEVISLMAEGDATALHVLTEILTKNQQGPMVILDMDDMNIRGRQISVGVKDVCKGDIKAFVQMVYHRRPWLVDEINKEVHDHRAVEQGASDASEAER